MPATNPQVDDYFAKLKTWGAELVELRAIVLGAGLTEAWKWRAPCYTLDGANVAILHHFKESCGIGFFKGALLKDPKGLLVKPGENSQAARVVRFTDVAEIVKNKPALRALIKNAIEVEAAGLKVERDKDTPLELPEELEARFEDDPALQAAFEALTPGRRRAYAMHFAAAKQSTTRVARIDKCAPRILDGKGLNDCVCGLTKKPPGCDGSHKSLA